MEFDEKFIEVEAGEITKKWQSVYAYNIVIARMIPELIDGLNPVKRRAIYTMFLKDGGKNFRKVLAISGDTVGKVHPHSSTSIESAIVGMGQPWKNTIPLIERKGNYGTCYDEDTEVLVLGYADAPNTVSWVKWKDFYDKCSGKLGSCDIETGEWLWEEPSNLVKYNMKERYADEPEKMIMIVGKNSGAGGAPGGAVDSSGGGQTGVSSTAGAPTNDPSLNNPIDLGETPPAPGGANKFIDFMVTEDHNMVIKAVSPAPDEDKFEFRKANDLPDVFQTKVKDIIIPEERKGFGEKHILPTPNMEPYGLWQPDTEYKDPDDLVWVVDAFGKSDLPMNIFLKVISVFLAYGKLTTEDKIELNDDATKVDLDDLKGLFEFEDDTHITDGNIVAFFKGYDEPIMPPTEEGEGGEEEAEEEEYPAFIPYGIFMMNTENIETFFSTYAEVTQSSPLMIKTTTQDIQYQFQALAVMTSKFTSLGQTDPECKHPVGKAQAGKFKYIVECKPEFEPRIEKKTAISTVEYKGDVYCAEMPTHHTMVTRRNEVTLIAGNCSGDSAGAPRYIQAKLSEYAQACYFEDWKDSVVDMELAYDEETMMPNYLPAKYPNVLVNGCLGVAYGISVQIPSYNFKEVLDATIMLMRDPNANIILIPDSPTGADIIEADFGAITKRGKGVYMQRCRYEIDPESNMITITALPERSTANAVRETIANIKEKGGLSELLAMNDLSGVDIKIELIIRDDVNPYKFMKKLISQVAGLEQSYPVTVRVTSDYMLFKYSIPQVLLEWIKWRREQKRTVLSNKRGTLYGEQRVNDIKLFIMNPQNLKDTLDIFRHSHNRQEIEEKLIAKYRHTEIMMDSVQARALSNMRMIELTIDAYEGYKKRAEEIRKELQEIEDTLNADDGVDKVIIAELREGIKRFGKPRRSRVVPYQISVSNEVDGWCILQLSSDGTIIRIPATNADTEPVPTDTNGFACLVDNDASFILIDDKGFHTFIRVKELPVNSEVPVFRYSKKPLDGKVVAMLPFDIESDKCCTLISRQGVVKKVRIADIGPSKKPIITIDKDDRIVKGIVLRAKSQKDLLIYTKNGMGQRLDPNSIRITSPSAKGMNGFKLKNDDEICGVYSISPEENSYLLYVTAKGKMRLNLIDYLPTRESKHDSMVQLIMLNDRDKLVAVAGCNKLDKATVYYDDSDSETIDISKLPESTMASEPKKVTSKNAVSNNITKVKIN